MLKQEHEVEVLVPVSEWYQVEPAESLHISYFGAKRKRQNELCGATLDALQ